MTAQQHKQGLPVRMDNVLMPTACALAVAKAYGGTLAVLTTRSVWQLGKKIAETHGGFFP
jgi:hypothetical protein